MNQRRRWILLVTGIILFEFGIANMLVYYPTNQQIFEPFPMTVLDWHFPFSYTYSAHAMYFQDDGTLYFDHYWMTWSISTYIGLGLIFTWTARFHKYQKNFYVKDL